jgi:TPR repeat protein
LTGAAVSRLFENGFEAYDRGDYSEALTLFRRAVDKGDANAVFLIGVIYFEGRGILQDCSEAAKWFHRAAEMGDVEAQLSLGFQYLRGQGVPRNNVLAHMWFDLADAHGTVEGARGRDIASLSMSRDQLAEAHRLTRDWKTSHR